MKRYIKCTCTIGFIFNVIFKKIILDFGVANKIQIDVHVDQVRQVYVINAICAIRDDINTEQNIKSICWPAVAQWKKRLIRNGL